FVITKIPGPVIRTRTPACGTPFCATLMCSVVVRPVQMYRDGFTVMFVHGGVKIGMTFTCADAELFASVVSSRSPETFAVFTCRPVFVGFVTSVIVTDSPTSSVPRSQLRAAPPVHDPFVVCDETYVLFAGITSLTVTPVSTSGPLFVTTIVHVMFGYGSF